MSTNNPEQEADISAWLDYVHSLHPNALAITMGQAIANLADKWRIKFSLLEIEQKLRDRNSRIFIVALPIEQQPEYIAWMPHTNIDYPFYLRFCVNGKDEYLEKLQEENVSHEENLARFPQSGMLVPKPNTNIARMYRGAGNPNQN